MGLNVAVLTVSDTRGVEEDSSGRYLADAAVEAGHRVVERCLERDEKYVIRARVAAWVADAGVQVVLVTGGTGFSRRDVTPEAVVPLFDQVIDGFGELFRQVSCEDIGTSTLQSRAVAGFSGGTAVFCMPGSTGACRTAWTRILREQLDINHQPCNFAELLLGSA